MTSLCYKRGWVIIEVVSHTMNSAMHNDIEAALVGRSIIRELCEALGKLGWCPMGDDFTGELPLLPLYSILTRRYGVEASAAVFGLYCCTQLDDWGGRADCIAAMPSTAAVTHSHLFGGGADDVDPLTGGVS